MDKYDFIKQLEAELSGLTDDERNFALVYYKELFEDAGSDKEQELISKLGSPHDIAESIIRESGMVSLREEAKNDAVNESNTTEQSSTDSPNDNNSNKKYHEVKRDSGTVILLAIILLFTSPAWLGLMIAFYSIIIAFLFTVIVIAAVFGIIGICGIISGIATIVAIPPVGLVFLGLGLLFTALTLLCTPPLCKGLFYICRAVINATVMVFRSIFYKREAVA